MEIKLCADIKNGGMNIKLDEYEYIFVGKNQEVNVSVQIRDGKLVVSGPMNCKKRWFVVSEDGMKEVEGE